MLSLLVLAFALVARYGLMESGWLPAECGGSLAEGVQGWCAAKWALIQSFLHQRLGWVSLVAGVLAFAVRSKGLALVGWFTGIAGLVLYSFDYAAVGAMLSLLVLARRFVQEGGREQQSGREPGDGLGVERL
ncbi:MAG TPA: hypothetical protein PLR02_09550 [Rhodocyclaceae bacterium]|nr:hypothetical protein [Rhodocyclaceae bacterium]